MHRLVFSSEDLPAELDDQARFALWCDLYIERYGEFDFRRTDDGPFSMRSEFAVVGDTGIARASGAAITASRTEQSAVTDKNDDFVVGLNRGNTRGYMLQRGREVITTTGQAMFWSYAEPCASRIEGWIGLTIPRARLLELVADAEDLIARPIDPNTPALRHLDRYLDFLFGAQELDGEPVLAEVHSATLVDLTALALGAGRDAAELARTGGLRAARAREILSEIRKDFANPGFSAELVGAKLGFSSRYVQELLQDTKFTLSERVLELRLQKARAMLGDPRQARLRISDIAFACGFNEVSYFNRCFRRRFGASPTQYRR
jgi:AraC-like DNA-binding protein